MTVTVTPTDAMAEEDQLRIDREVGLLRSALLYADDIDLLSPTAELIAHVSEFSGLSLTQFLRKVTADTDMARSLGAAVDEPGWAFVCQQYQDADPQGYIDRLEKEAFDDTMSDEDRAELVEAFSQIRHFSSEENMKPLLDNMTSELREREERSHYSELAPFPASNRIRLSPSGGRLEDDDMLSQLTAALEVAARDPYRYLLTDEYTAGFVQKMIDSRSLTIPSRAAKNSREASFHAGFIQALPSLPNAPMDVIAGIREDMNDALLRYRTETASLSSTYAGPAYDPDIAADILHAWITQVSPAIAEVQAAFSFSKRFKGFVQTLGISSTAPAGLGLVSHLWFAWMPTMPQLMTGLVASTATSAAAAFHTSGEPRRRAPDMRFYFLHEADRLAQGTFGQSCTSPKVAKPHYPRDDRIKRAPLVPPEGAIML